MSAKFIGLSFFIISLSFCHAKASPIGVVESWEFVSGIQDTYSGITQVYDYIDTVQSPFQEHQQLDYRQSSSNAFINAIIDDQNLLLTVQPEQHCEKTETSLPSCLSLGEIYLTPLVDVAFDFQGSYSYHLGGSPTAVSSYIRVTQMTPAGNVGPTIASQVYFYDSLNGPIDGTMDFSQTVTLFARNRYWVKYRFLSHASYGASLPGSFVNGNGILTISTHPVPELSTGVVFGIVVLFCLGRNKNYGLHSR